jgi:hypothetical protein
VGAEMVTRRRGDCSWGALLSMSRLRGEDVSDAEDDESGVWELDGDGSRCATPGSSVDGGARLGSGSGSGLNWRRDSRLRTRTRQSEWNMPKRRDFFRTALVLARVA